VSLGNPVPRRSHRRRGLFEPGFGRRGSSMREGTVRQKSTAARLRRLAFSDQVPDRPPTWSLSFIRKPDGQGEELGEIGPMSPRTAWPRAASRPPVRSVPANKITAPSAPGPCRISRRVLQRSTPNFAEIYANAYRVSEESAVIAGCFSRVARFVGPRGDPRRRSVLLRSEL